MTNDYAPEFLLGEPVDEYKAITCLLDPNSAAVAKGDFVTLKSSATTDPCPTVTASVKDDFAYGTCMRAGTPGQYISVVRFGRVKATMWGTVAMGSSLLPHSQSTLYAVTTKTGFARAEAAMGCGDTGLVFISGGVT